MENLTGWAAGMWAKQKMGNMGGGKEKPSEAPAMRRSLAEQRAERNAEHEKRKAERASKKTSAADKWKANKQQG